MKIFERNTVLWADKFIYASTYDQSILNHGIKYRDKPFGIIMPNTYPGFIIPHVQVKRVNSK
jgi:hypothetical protein